MKKTKGSNRHASAGRKPIRPIERQKMRPWLFNLLVNEDVASIKWEARKDNTFKIAWRHAARQGWNPRDDADLFERWARHTGKFLDGDDPDPKRWKANFRCALNSLPDVEELKDRSVRKGNNAFKIYRFLDEKKMKTKCRQVSHTNRDSSGEHSPKRTSRRLQDKPHRRFIDSESDNDDEMSDEECQSPRQLDSDEISTSGSEPEWISERSSRLSTDSSELPVFEKICREADMQIFKEAKHSYNFMQYHSKMPEHSPSILSTSDDDDQCSIETDMTEEELVELILNVESPQNYNIVELKDEPCIDIWTSVAADVTIGGDMDQDMTHGCAVINETPNVITEHLIDNQDMCYTSLDPSLV